MNERQRKAIFNIQHRSIHKIYMLGVFHIKFLINILLYAFCGEIIEMKKCENAFFGGTKIYIFVDSHLTIKLILKFLFIFTVKSVEKFIGRRFFFSFHYEFVYFVMSGLLGPLFTSLFTFFHCVL